MTCEHHLLSKIKGSQQKTLGRYLVVLKQARQLMIDVCGIFFPGNRIAHSLESNPFFLQGSSARQTSRQLHGLVLLRFHDHSGLWCSHSLFGGRGLQMTSNLVDQAHQSDRIFESSASEVNQAGFGLSQVKRRYILLARREL